MRTRGIAASVSRRDLLSALARSDPDIRIEVEDLEEQEIRMLDQFGAEVEGGLVTLHGPRDRASRQLAELLARRMPGVIAVRFAEPLDVPPRTS